MYQYDKQCRSGTFQCLYNCSHPSIALSRSPGEQVYIAELPFCNFYGWLLFSYLCLVNGDTVVIHPIYNATRFVESIQKYKVS